MMARLQSKCRRTPHDVDLLRCRLLGKDSMGVNLAECGFFDVHFNEFITDSSTTCVLFRRYRSHTSML